MSRVIESSPEGDGYVYPRGKNLIGRWYGRVHWTRRATDALLRQPASRPRKLRPLRAVACRHRTYVPCPNCAHMRDASNHNRCHHIGYRNRKSGPGRIDGTGADLRKRHLDRHQTRSPSLQLSRPQSALPKRRVPKHIASSPYLLLSESSRGKRSLPRACSANKHPAMQRVVEMTSLMFACAHNRLPKLRLMSPFETCRRTLQMSANRSGPGVTG